MKNTVRKIWGVGLVVTLLATLLISVLPASAGTLSLTKETDYPSTTDNIFTTNTTTDMAVSADGNTVYVVTGTSNKIYKSTNGGATFSALTSPSTANGTTKIAIAPDDANVIVVTGNITGVAGTPGAWVSTNGGSTFSALHNAANVITDGTSTLMTIYDIDIAPLDGSTRYVAIAGIDTAPTGTLLYFNLGSAAPSWANAGGLAFTGEPIPTSYVAAKFSPNFPSDQVITTVTAGDGGSTNITYHVASFNTKTWDGAVFDGYPKNIETITGALTVNAADIALDPEYLGGDDTTRIAFIGYSALDNATNTGSLWRFKDVTPKELVSSATEINKVDWNGTNLVAGAYDSNNVYRSDDALATSPTVSTSRANKEIGIDAAGNDAVVVAWAGSTVYGVKQGTGSAFSKSTDNGRTWNDQSLMNTTTATYLDFAVAKDGSVKYILAADGTNGLVEVFRKATAWQRVFCIANTQADWIIRLASGDPNVVYLADRSNTLIYYAKDGGLEQWTQRTSRYSVQDLAVQDVDVAYVAKTAGTTVSKSTNGGFTWATEKETTLAGGQIATITLIAADNIIVGSTTGYVAYSTDGNSSWSKISTALTTGGNTQVTADSLATNGYIYAASDGANSRIERWQVGQSSTAWKNMSAPTTAGYMYTGLMLYDGILYSVSNNTTDSELLRDIEPSNATPASTHWSTIASAGEIFNAAPSALRMSTGSNKVWVINNIAADELYSFTDTLVITTKIAQVAPADKFINPINPVSGNSQDIAFSWTAPTTGSLAYEVRIYAADKTTVLLTATRVAIETTTPNKVIGPTGDTGTSAQMTFSPGTLYYWAVRVASPAYSPWSDQRSFTIQPLQSPAPAILSPVNGSTIEATNPAFSWSPITGTTSYTFQLALIPDFSVPLVNTAVAAAGIRPTVKLDTGMTYFWRVRAQAPVQGDWSATANFIVAEAAEATPPVVITQTPPPVISIPAPPPATTFTIPPPPAPAQIAPGYIWAIIIIGAVLVIAVIVLIVRTRRTV